MKIRTNLPSLVPPVKAGAERAMARPVPEAADRVQLGPALDVHRVIALARCLGEVSEATPVPDLAVVQPPTVTSLQLDCVARELLFDMEIQAALLAGATE